MKDIVQQLGEYADQSDLLVKALREELANSAELLLTHHAKIYNMSEMLSRLDDQRSILSRAEEDNIKLRKENESLVEVTNELDFKISLGCRLYFFDKESSEFEKAAWTRPIRSSCGSDFSSLIRRSPPICLYQSSASLPQKSEKRLITIIIFSPLDDHHL
eukprot:gene13648-16070_t